MKTFIGIAVAVFVSAWAGAQDGKVPVYVFTATAAEGFTDPVQKARLEAVADIQKEIGKKKGLAVVRAPNEAKLHVEVTDAGKRPTGATRRSGWSTRDEIKNTVVAMLTVGTYQLELKHYDKVDSPIHPTSRKIADDVEQWVKDNRQTLERP